MSQPILSVHILENFGEAVILTTGKYDGSIAIETVKAGELEECN